jgi:hypothetical protein
MGIKSRSNYNINLCTKFNCKNRNILCKECIKFNCYLPKEEDKCLKNQT